MPVRLLVNDLRMRADLIEAHRGGHLPVTPSLNYLLLIKPDYSLVQRRELIPRKQEAAALANQTEANPQVCFCWVVLLYVVCTDEGDWSIGAGLYGRNCHGMCMRGVSYP